MDYSKLSNEDLINLYNGNYSKLSDEGLRYVYANNKPQQTEYERIANDNSLTREQKAQAINKYFEKEQRNIQKERWRTHAKNFGGAALEIGSAAIPIGGGAKLATKLMPKAAPVLKNLAGNAIGGGIAGGVSGFGRGLRNNENPLQTAMQDTALGAGLAAGLPIAGKAAQGAVKLLPASGNVVARGVARLQPETLKRAVQPDSKALDLTKEQAQNLLMDTTERIQNTYKEILNNKGKNIGNAVSNLDINVGVPINSLKADLNDIYNSYSKSGDKNFNKAFNEAGDVYDDVLNMLEKGEIPQAQIDRENFVDFYNKMLRGEINPRQQANILSQTPEVWLQHGIPNQKIVTNQNILKKMGSESNIYKKNHNISAKTIEKLPDLLFDPKYILKSNTQDGRFVGVLNANDDLGRPILGILNPQGDVNFIPSAYGRNNFNEFINNQEKLGNILYNKGVTPTTPKIGVEQGTPITSIADLPKNINLSATKLYEFLHGGMPKIKWEDINADTKNNILERIYGKYSSRLSDLSPELKQANSEYAKVKNFQKNEGLNSILNPRNLKNSSANKIDNASTKLRNYNSTVTSGNKNRNIQNLEQLFIDEGYQPFLHDVDDVNAAMDLLNARSTGDSWLANITTQLSRPTLKGVRAVNRFTSNSPFIQAVSKTMPQFRGLGTLINHEIVPLINLGRE